MKRLAIATCESLRQGHPEDLLLEGFLRQQGWDVERRVWNRDEFQPDEIKWVRTTWDYHHHTAEFLKWTAKQTRLLNSAPLIQWNASKEYLSWMCIMGMPTVPSHILAAEDDRIPYADSELVCVKPIISASAERTFLIPRVDLEDDAKKKEIWSRYPEGRCLLQPFQPSIATAGEASLIFFCDRDIHFSHAVLKKPADGDFRVQTDFGGTIERFFPDPSLQDWCLQFLATIKDSWIAARVDILNWDTEPMLSELELIEPQLYLRYAPESLGNAWDALEWWNDKI